jgi:SAM-dependent methyltransferase
MDRSNTANKDAVSFSGEFFVPGHSPIHVEENHLERYRFAAKYVAGKSVLDIACGTGYGSQILMDGGAESYFGVDLGDEPVAFAKSNFKRDRVSFLQGDILTVNPGRQFDLIISFETIEHIADYKDSLLNLNRLLEPDGILIISTPNRPICSPKALTLNDKPSNPYHVQEFTLAEFCDILKDTGYTYQKDGVYGQRQRKYSSWHAFMYQRRITRMIYYCLLGNPNWKTSAQVTPVVDLVPRYYVIVARKSGGQ